MDGGCDLFKNKSVFENVTSTNYNWSYSNLNFGGFEYEDYKRN